MDWYTDAIREIIISMLIIPAYIIRLILFIILFPFIYTKHVKKILIYTTKLIDKLQNL